MTVEMNKAAVRAFYDGVKRGDLAELAHCLIPTFVYRAPRYLPWGGEMNGAGAFVGTILPRVMSVLDFGRLSYGSFVAEENRVVALIEVGVLNMHSSVEISEHWTFDSGMAQELWTACFEPAALLSRLESDW